MRPELFVILKTQTSVLMRYTYRFTQISREENGNLVPVIDNPYVFVFTFGKKIDNDSFLGKTPDKSVLLTKDMWKEHPATNKEILATVCFSAPSLKGYCRPLVMTKDADHRAGEYKYDEVDGNEIKDGQYLSEDIRLYTRIFVNGVWAINDNARTALWNTLKGANVKYMMSYIKSYVYIQLLQDKDQKGKVRSEEFLKKVLETFFSLIPDKAINRFDKGLKAHDEIRAKLEGIPEDDKAKIEAILESHGFFKSIEDFYHFTILRDYILRVKNNFNHLVWIMYRSKIGLVSLKSVRAQLGAIYEFAINVQDDCKPKSKTQIIEAICAGDLYYNTVAGFLETIDEIFDVQKMNKSYRAALCYKFQEECHYKYLNSRYKYGDEIAEEYRPIHREEFRDLCLRYWGIDEKSTLKPNKCLHLMKKFSSERYDEKIWNIVKKRPQNN